MSTPVYEMLWDCAYCGTPKLLGKTHRFCPKCGAPQDTTRRYFPPEGEEVAVEGHVYVGADRTCESCGSAMSAAAQHCTQCGGALAGAKEVALVEDRPAGTAPVAAEPPPAVPLAAPEASRPSRWLPRLALGCGGLVALVIAFFLVAVFWTEEASATAVRHTWERTVAVESLTPRSESAWCDSLPAGAYGVSRKREVRSHRQVKTGEDCSNRRVDQGDGTFRVERDCSPRYREEPIYGDRCHFTVDRWGVVRTARDAGDGSAARWPELGMLRAGDCRGCEREGSRSETYRVSFQMRGGDPFECTLPEARWREIGDGTRWTVEKSAVTGTAFCGTLRAAR
jgi:hypothetical protein